MLHFKDICFKYPNFSNVWWQPLKNLCTKSHWVYEILLKQFGPKNKWHQNWLKVEISIYLKSIYYIINSMDLFLLCFNVFKMANLCFHAIRIWIFIFLQIVTILVSGTYTCEIHLHWYNCCIVFYFQLNKFNIRGDTLASGMGMSSLSLTHTHIYIILDPENIFTFYYKAHGETILYQFHLSIVQGSWLEH